MASFPGRKPIAFSEPEFVLVCVRVSILGHWDISHELLHLQHERWKQIFQGSCGKHKDKNEAGEGLPQWTLLHNSRAKALSNLERCYTGDFISKISKQLFEIFPWATKDSLALVTRIFTHHNFLLRWFNFNRFFFCFLSKICWSFVYENNV